MYNQQQIKQILGGLTTRDLDGCQRSLDVLQALSNKEGGLPFKPQVVVDAVSDCVHKKLAGAVLFLAAERAEASSNKKVQKWAPAYDWMRHTLMQHDVEQLPAIAEAADFLAMRKFKSACKWAEIAGGLNEEFAAVVELWRNN